jgi:hypothetical protein
MVRETTVVGNIHIYMYMRHELTEYKGGASVNELRRISAGDMGENKKQYKMVA